MLISIRTLTLALDIYLVFVIVSVETDLTPTDRLG